jgi:SH3-like domain-containing protein
MKKWWITAVLAVVSASAYAQEKVALTRSLPFEGEVSADNLNVRMFPKGDPNSSIITSVLHLGERVSVVGEQGDYFQIRPPKGSTVWVSAKSMKKDGATATAIASEVPVRLDSRVNADQVASLKEGEAVKVVTEHMGWFKIESPDAVKYFVGKKFVKATNVVNAVAPPRDEPRRAAKVEPRVEDADVEAKKEIVIAESLLDEQKRLIDAKQMRQVDFTEVVKRYETAKALAKTDAVRAEADRGLKRYKDIAVLWQTTKAQIEAAEERAAAEKAVVSQKPVDAQKGYVMTGFVDTTGLLWKRPGTHKLVMGGKIVCFLRVKEGDDRMLGRLNDCYQKYVGINGTIIRNPDGWDGYSVVVVEEVAPVQEPQK